MRAFPSATTQSRHERLRHATRTAHAQLESALNLLAAPIASDRIVCLLERFHGFHAAWEPALKGLVPDELLAPRLKLALLRQDLRSLGVGDRRLRALPDCHAAAGLCATEADAAGALYVMEGSTLGGRIISRSLQESPWLGRRRLQYWNPYGEDTGKRWSETLAYLESLPSSGSDAIIRSAIATFDVLHAWLLPELPLRGQPS